MVLKIRKGRTASESTSNADLDSDVIYGRLVPIDIIDFMHQPTRLEKENNVVFSITKFIRIHQANLNYYSLWVQEDTGSILLIMMVY